MEWGAAVKGVCYREELIERNMRSDLMGWDGLSNESVYERCGMSGHGSGCGVVG